MIIYKEKNGDRIFAVIAGEAVELDLVGAARDQKVQDNKNIGNENDLEPETKKDKRVKYRKSAIKSRKHYQSRTGDKLTPITITPDNIQKELDTESPGGGDTTKPWSRKFDACIDCGTNEKKHQSGGRCFTCYQKNRTTKAADIAEEREEKRGTVKQWECTDCYHKFESTLDKLDIYCLKCGDVHCVQI